MSEIGKLTAVFDADTRKFDVGMRGMEKGIKNVTGTIGNLGISAQGLDGVLGGLGGRFSGLSSIASGLGGSLGVVGVGLGVVAVAAVSLGSAMFGLAKRAADAGDEIFDLTQKINFSAESLSALKSEGELAGVEFGAISASLGIFNKNIELASQGDKKLSGTFKALHVDLRDNETALRQSFKALLALQDKSQQVALAMALFGRSGKEVLGIIKSMNGDIDKSIEKFREMGSLITTDAATAANDFSDKLKMLQQRLDGLVRVIGNELIPVVEQAIDDISAWLQRNQGELRQTAKDLATVVEWVYKLGKVIADNSALVITVRVVRLFENEENKFINPFRLTRPAAPPQRAEDEGEFAIAGGAGQFSVGAGPPKLPRARISIPGSGGRGGGGGGKGEDRAKIAERLASLQLEATIAGLKAEQDANKRALDLRRRDFDAYATQYMVIENRRHDAVIAGLDREQKAAEKLKKGREVALQEISNKRAEETTTHEQNRNRVLDERGKILDQMNDFIRDQEREIAGLTTATDQWDQAYQQLVDTLKEEGVELESNTKSRIESNVAMLKEIDLVKQQIRVRQVLLSVRERLATKAGNERPPWIDLGGGSTVGGEPATTTRPRIATVDEQVMREKLAKIREQMHQLGDDLTGVFSQSISDGFNNGIKSGLQTLTQGLLRIVEDIFLKRMAQGLGDILSGVAGGNGGGGGFWSKLPGIILGSLAGGIGGGGGSGSTGGLGTVFAGSFASGGVIPMGQWGMVHENEKVIVGPRGAQVIPSSTRGGGKTEIHNHYTINLPPDSRGSYSSPKSKRQLSETLLAALQAANT